MSESTGSGSTKSGTTPSEIPPFDPSAMTRAASDSMSVRRVFGEAYEHNGTKVVPVAKLIGGTGNGFGIGTASGSGVPGRGAKADETTTRGLHGESEGTGGGGGFGALVRPIGVYVIDDAGVHWRPAVDVNRAIFGGQAVAIVVSLSLAWILRRRFR